MVLVNGELSSGVSAFSLALTDD